MRSNTINRIIQITFVPSLVLVAILTMYTRTNVVLKAVEKGEVAAMFSPAAATAQTAPGAATPPAASVKPTDKTADAPPAKLAEPEPSGANGDAVDVLTSEDVTILQQLKTRRAALDARSDQLDQREALLQATEKRLDDKMAQLQATRSQIQALIGQMDEQQQAQVGSLVKIYENMKPQQAAAIFQQLDMPVLLQVLAKMKEAKASLVLAAMDPTKAKAVTTELMKKKELPKLDSAPIVPIAPNVATPKG